MMREDLPEIVIVIKDNKIAQVHAVDGQNISILDLDAIEQSINQLKLDVDGMDMDERADYLENAVEDILGPKPFSMPNHQATDLWDHLSDQIINA